jgi:monoamine oxidase
MLILIFCLASVFALPYDVIVIGGGVSGITAARHLMDRNKTVFLVEARDRPFGRVWSNTDLGFPIDIGAAWIHGMNGNPLNELARRNAVKFVKTDFLNAQVYNLDNGTVIPNTLLLLEMVRFTVSKEIVDNHARALPNDVSLDSLFKKERQSHTLNPLQAKLWDLNIGLEIELPFATDIYNLGAKHYDDEEEFGGDHVMFPNGYRHIFDKMLVGMNISYSTVVSGIEKKSHFRVHTNKGVFEAKKVIVTVPLGVLKENTIRFSPPLPEWKLKSIEKLGFGLMNKVVLLFPNSPWFGYDIFLTTPSNRSGNFPLILNWKKYSGHNALVAFSVGKFAEDLEMKDDKSIVDMVFSVVKTCFPTISPPTKYLISRWRKDLFSRGSYTYMKVNSTDKDRINMGLPVDGLHFAGESTSEEYMSTVHGAYFSGIKAASQVEKEIETATRK